jgi:hypothetical protein
MLRGHPLVLASPTMAAALGEAMDNDIIYGTARSYDSVANNYVQFCEMRGLEPWPADAVLVSAWILRIVTRVKPSSLQVYLAGVRRIQLNLGHSWLLRKSEMVRRTLRYVKRKFPSSGKALLKLPVCLQVLRRILPLLSGWPDLTQLSFDDLVYACASVVAVCAFLRGGEFLFTPGQTRPILCHRHFSFGKVRGKPALIVFVPQTKTDWWHKEARVPIFPSPTSSFDPHRLWTAVCKRSPLVGSDGIASSSSLPAFHNADGQPLRKKDMVKRTMDLVRQADLAPTDDRGRAMKVQAASWRAGGVRSATDANVSEPLIMELGRWKSRAWTNYLLYTGIDLCGASDAMWSASTPHSRSLRVAEGGVYPGPQCLVDDEATVGEVCDVVRSREKEAVASSSVKRPRAQCFRGESSRAGKRPSRA